MAYSWLPPWCRCCHDTHLTDEETEAQRWQNLPEGPQLLSIPCQNLAPGPTLYQWTIQPPNSPCKEKTTTSRQKRKFLFCLGIAVVRRLISSMDLLLAQQHFQGDHWGGCPTQREVILNSQVMSLCATVAFCLWFFPSFSLCWPPPAFLLFLLLFISFSFFDSFRGVQTLPPPTCLGHTSLVAHLTLYCDYFCVSETVTYLCSSSLWHSIRVDLMTLRNGRCWRNQFGGKKKEWLWLLMCHVRNGGAPKQKRAAETVDKIVLVGAH